MKHEEIRDPGEQRIAELLELLLGGRPGSESELERRRRDPESAAELAGLEAFLKDCRGSLGEEPAVLAPERERALIERVLDGSTREDLGWRGDLRLVGRFIGDRLAASSPLRVAAALLLANVIGLPILAWIAVRTSVEEPMIVFEVGMPADPSHLAEEVEDDPELTGAPDLDELEALDEAVLISATAHNNLARARFWLRNAGAPEPVQAGEGEVAQLLAARAALLAYGVRAEAWPALPASDSLAAALHLELALDAFALAGRDPQPALDHCLPLLSTSDGDPVGALGRHALERSRGYGLLQRPAEVLVAPPVDAAWLSDLERALAGRGPLDPAARAWTGWIPRTPAAGGK